MLYNKNMAPPYVPTFTSPSDTHNFEVFVEEDANLMCTEVDQNQFADF